jgi:hypothetical protein
MQAEVIKKCSWCRTPILTEFKLCPDCKEKYEKDMAYERAISYQAERRQRESESIHGSCVWGKY